jgi:methylenetetrahydrofolate--tRNA-(uracil-5-)-methyltransferase
MGPNFGIVPSLEGKKIKDKRERYSKISERGLNYIKGLDIELYS